MSNRKYTVKFKHTMTKYFTKINEFLISLFVKVKDNSIKTVESFYKE